MKSGYKNQPGIVINFANNSWNKNVIKISPPSLREIEDFVIIYPHPSKEGHNLYSPSEPSKYSAQEHFTAGFNMF